MGRSGGVLWWFFSVWISYICSPSERTGILEITISFMATCRCFTWNTVFWKSIQRLGKLIYTNGGSQKNASSILLLLTSKKWLCVLIPWEAEPHFPTTEWASLLHVFVDVSRETRWGGWALGLAIWKMPLPPRAVEGAAFHVKRGSLFNCCGNVWSSFSWSLERMTSLWEPGDAD